ncbi:MAG: hypothetical protein AAF354_01790 [Pseudomonadota bacterium]
MCIRPFSDQCKLIFDIQADAIRASTAPYGDDERPELGLSVFKQSKSWRQLIGHWATAIVTLNNAYGANAPMRVTMLYVYQWLIRCALMRAHEVANPL